MKMCCRIVGEANNERYCCRLENKFWYMPSKFMPLKLAREMDDANQDAGETGEGAVDSIDCRKYLQPCLKTKAIAPETWDAGAKPSFENEDV